MRKSFVQGEKGSLDRIGFRCFLTYCAVDGLVERGLPDAANLAISL
jgi:hypothetical protein